MKALVVYDTNFENTKLIAQAIASTLGTNTRLSLVSDISKEKIKGIDLLVVGSPINGWRSTQRMEKFLAGLEKEELKGINATTFDTRIRVFFSGDAKNTMAKHLQHAGATIIAEPEAFFVEKTEGPLCEGELAKAKKWASEIKYLEKYEK